jgi:hypothetical protein
LKVSGNGDLGIKIEFEIRKKGGEVFAVFENDSFVYAAIVDVVVTTSDILFDDIFTGHYFYSTPSRSVLEGGVEYGYG